MSTLKEITAKRGLRFCAQANKTDEAKGRAYPKVQPDSAKPRLIGQPLGDEWG